MYQNNDWRPYWQPNTLADRCTNKECDTIFNLLNRKHHCRQCGKIFCYKCWGKTKMVKSYNKPVFVCNACHQS